MTERLEIGLHIWSTLGWHKTSEILVNSMVSDWIQNDCSGQRLVQNFISLEQDIPSNEGVYQFSVTCSVTRGGGGGEPSHMEGAGMLVVSLRGINFGFWSYLVCSGENAITLLAVKVSF